MLKSNLFLAFAVLWTIVILFLSLATIGTIGESISVPFKDKYVHFTFYFVFTLLWNTFFYYRNSNSNFKFKVVLIAITLGVLLEIAQGIFTTTRTPDILDVLANSIGAIIGTVLISKIYKNKTT